MNDLIERMKSGGLGSNMQEAESLLELHQEHKVCSLPTLMSSYGATGLTQLRLVAI